MGCGSSRAADRKLMKRLALLESAVATLVASGPPAGLVAAGSPAGSSAESTAGSASGPIAGSAARQPTGEQSATESPPPPLRTACSYIS